MPLRATQRETCEGSSDNVVMPMDEFRRTIDGAIRIARNFDNGDKRILDLSFSFFDLNNQRNTNRN